MIEGLLMICLENMQSHFFYPLKNLNVLYFLQECAPGYKRVGINRCDKIDSLCPPGYYGNPSRGIECQRCPCPSLPNQYEWVHELSDDEHWVACKSLIFFVQVVKKRMTENISLLLKKLYKVQICNCKTFVIIAVYISLKVRLEQNTLS